ncbi:MAG: hypothetical protein AAFN27_17405 [Pseudomonadota bacterium]
MLDLDALARLDMALAELSSEFASTETLSPLARGIVEAAPAPRCPHMARMAAE